MSRLLVLLFVALLFPTPSPLFAAPLSPIGFQENEPALVVVLGRAVCLDSTGREGDSFFGCEDANHSFGFASKAGKLYRFLPGDAMTAMFTDIRVRQRELQVTARLHSGSRLEVIKVQSVKEGKLYDIFYYCDVCNIKSYAPGLCPCCRNELEFKETPP
jgi:hypothetical protein